MAAREGRQTGRVPTFAPKGDEFTAVNYCEYCYNVIYEKDPSWHEPDQWSGAGGIPEIAFSFEHAAEVRKVLDQWNYLL